jgi:hypothetical protein
MTPRPRDESLMRRELEFRILAYEPCCDHGVRVHCVCRISVSCPVHGVTCIGTHD